jgi:hypothetical protein
MWDYRVKDIILASRNSFLILVVLSFYDERIPAFTVVAGSNLIQHKPFRRSVLGVSIRG